MFYFIDYSKGWILLMLLIAWRHRDRRSIEDGNCAEAEAPRRGQEIAALVPRGSFVDKDAHLRNDMTIGAILI